MEKGREEKEEEEGEEGEEEEGGEEGEKETMTAKSWEGAETWEVYLEDIPFSGEKGER